MTKNKTKKRKATKVELLEDGTPLWPERWTADALQRVGKVSEYDWHSLIDSGTTGSKWSTRELLEPESQPGRGSMAWHLII